jgi:inosose dehydratase
LDTGHIVVGGGSPLEIAKKAGSRVKHVHLKDCDAQSAGRIQRKESSYSVEVKNGMYRPLGQGDAQIAEVIQFLESIKYGGLLVLEQDVMLADNPPISGGPIANVRASIDFLKSVVAGL